MMVPREQTLQSELVSFWFEFTIQGALQHFSKQKQPAAVVLAGNCS